MIYITGDTHGSISKLIEFQEGKELTKNDYVIVAGDFGLVWSNSDAEMYQRELLDNAKFTTLFVDGNHENFNLLNNFPVVKFMGGKAHKISNSIYHLMRGEVFEIDGKKIFCMGGAVSVDKAKRVKGVSWWSEELPNGKDFNRAIENLLGCGNEVDYVVSHSAPLGVESLMFGHGSRVHNRLAKFFEYVIRQDIKYNHWYFGHYHSDICFDSNHTMVKERMIKIA